MLLKFGFVSGLGWILDFSIFSALCYFGMQAGLANAFAASVAVTFVFFSSLRPIFRDHGNYVGRKLLIYWVYQMIAVSLASYSVGYLAITGLNPLLSKVVVTPVTFMVNFLFMRWLATIR